MRMRVRVAASALIALSLGVWGCSNSGYSGRTPTGPTAPMSGPDPNPGAGPSNIVTVNVVAINGAQSFSPNPADLPAGQMIVWHNIDSVTHHVVLNDGSLDTGDLAPGASSRPMAVAPGGGPYHCSIHPVMVGSINQDTPSGTPPCRDAYCS